LQTWEPMGANTSVVTTTLADTIDTIDGQKIAILAEDDDILAVAKPAGLVTHPAYRHADGTLTDAVFAYAARCGAHRPWLLHRLDRETSGVVLFARTEQARRSLVRQFQRREIVKRYLAIVNGRPGSGSGEIDAPLCRDVDDRRRVVVSPAGKPARTRYEVCATNDDFSLVIAEPLTGRTHQIRVHLASLGAPLAGDTVYGGATETTSAIGIERTQLHAWELSFRHPATGSACAVRAPIPDDMSATLAALGLGDNITT
jgi:23S rRNA pseudouridine1911/1915/1917 synthase